MTGSLSRNRIDFSPLCVVPPQACLSRVAFWAIHPRYEQVSAVLTLSLEGALPRNIHPLRLWRNMPTLHALLRHQDPGYTRRELLEVYGEYAARQEANYGNDWLACRRRLAKPVWHLFHGEKGGKKFRYEQQRTSAGE